MSKMTVDPQMAERLTDIAADLDASISALDGDSEAMTPEQVLEVLATLAMDLRTLARGEIPDVNDTHPAHNRT